MNIVRDVGANSVWRMASPSTVSEDEIDLAWTIMDDASRRSTRAPAAALEPTKGSRSTSASGTGFTDLLITRAATRTHHRPAEQARIRCSSIFGMAGHVAFRYA
jgi:hypothetical protein